MQRTSLTLRACLVVLAAALAACTQPAERSATSTENSVALDGYHWQLRDAHDAAGQALTVLTNKPGNPLALRFDADRVQLSNGCNQMGAAVTIKRDAMDIGDTTSTMMACADERLMRFDAAAAKALHGRVTWTIKQDHSPLLTLTNAGRDVLVFAGEPTAETRYGGPGETRFLEVAAQTKACSHPLIPNMQCLQVREVQFDDRGIRSKTPGDFQHFYDAIEGYNHQPGVRNVLRVKRYTVQNPPADASNTAWVLDMVVESEVVKP